MYSFERNDELSWSVYSRVYLVRNTDFNEIIASFVIGYDRIDNLYYIAPAGYMVIEKLNKSGIFLPKLTFEEQKAILCDFFKSLHFMEPADLIDANYYPYGIAAMKKMNFYFHSSEVYFSTANELSMTHYDSDWNELLDNEILIPYKFDSIELDNIRDYCDTDCLDFSAEVLREYIEASEELGLATLFEINFDYLYE